MAALRRGRLVVLPTDTVYGIAALPRSQGGTAELFAVKERPSDKAIPVLGASPADLAEVVDFDDRARAVAGAFWPGPLTLVLPRRAGWPYDLGGADPTTIAVRVPSHPTTRALLELSGPLAVTSANRSGAVPATSIEEARAALGDAVAVYLDGGRCEGAPSSVVSLVDGLELLRAGAVSLEEIHSVIE